MTSMQERAERIGASLTIVTAPRSGTEVVLAWEPAFVMPAQVHAAQLNAASPPRPSRRRVLLVDDHALLRTGVANIINQEPDLHVVAEAGNGVEAVEAFERHRPDVTLLDLRMPVMEGVEAVRRIRERDPQARVIVLTTYDTDEDISRALKAGAKAYILKDISADALVDCIRDVLAGKTYLAPAAAAKLAEGVTRVQLTPRELATLRLMADGKANKEIASDARHQRAHRQDPPRPPVREARRHQPHRSDQGRHAPRPGAPRVSRLRRTAQFVRLAVMPATNSVCKSCRTAEVLERLRALRSRQPVKYTAFYSSQLGGIVTDPALMVIPFDDHMVHRGHGIFDTAGIVNGKIYDLEAHLDRFLQVRRALEAEAAVARATRCATSSSGPRRPAAGATARSVTGCRRAPGSLDLTPVAGADPGFFVMIFPGLVYPERWKTEGVRVMTTTYPIKPPLYAITKTTNYLPNVLMQMEAKEKGFDNGVFIDHDGHVGESSNMNVAFVSHDGVLCIRSSITSCRAARRCGCWSLRRSW